MIRLSIPVRQALERLVLPMHIAAALGLMVLAKADAGLALRARSGFTDALVPLFAGLARPLANVRDIAAEARGLLELRAENVRLREENGRLRHWREAAMALAAENDHLKAGLNYVPGHAPKFVTAPVVADAGGVYARAVLLSAGLKQGVAKGQIAMDGQGVAGRVTEAGNHSARVLLLTDINSRIPVVLGNNRARAILFGTNGPRPRLMYWPEGAAPVEGERVVTSAEANAFPAGLPVGTVRYGSSHAADVEPAAQLGRLDLLRIFDYGLQSIAPDGTDRMARGRDVAERPR